MHLLIRALRRFYRLVYFEKLGRLLPGAAVSSGSPEKAAVALSFDDGPNPPYTQQVLDILDQHRVQATFFLVGRNVLEYPTVVQEIAARGHCLGTHSFTHHHQIKECILHFGREIIRPHRLISDLAGVEPVLFRPPYGAQDPVLFALLKWLMGYSVIQWSVDPQDWKMDPPEIIAQRVLSHVAPGSIVLLHDRSEMTVNALSTIINQLHSQGYRFVTLPDLLDLEAGALPVEREASADYKVAI